MRRMYKYRLYPNRAQSEALDFLLWQGRNLYNAALEQRIMVYKETKKGVTYPAQWTYFRDVRNAHPDTLGQLNATSVQQMLRRLNQTFKSFFRRLKTGDTPGFPRFKGRDRFHSLAYRHSDGCKLREQDQPTRFYVQHVGEVKIKMHRPLPAGVKLGHVILKRSVGRWYVCFSVEMPDAVSISHTGPCVGVDVGLKSLPALSDGHDLR